MRAVRFIVFSIVLLIAVVELFVDILILMNTLPETAQLWGLSNTEALGQLSILAFLNTLVGLAAALTLYGLVIRKRKYVKVGSISVALALSSYGLYQIVSGLFILPSAFALPLSIEGFVFCVIAGLCYWLGNV